MNNYFQQELNIEVFHQPQEFEFNGKNFSSVMATVLDLAILVTNA